MQRPFQSPSLPPCISATRLPPSLSPSPISFSLLLLSSPFFFYIPEEDIHIRERERERELMDKVESPLDQEKSKEENLEQEEEDKEDQINKGGEEKPDKKATKEEDQGDESQATHSDAASISADIDHFLSVAGIGRDGQNQSSHHDPPEIPETAIERSASLVEKEITRYESVAGDWSRKSDELSLLDAIHRISKLSATLSTIFPSETKAKKRAGAVIQRAMSFLEEEFRSLLEDSITKPEPRRKISKSKKPRSLPGPNHNNNASPTSPETTSGGSPETDPIYPPAVIEKLRKIAGVMIAAGYETECCQVFSITRRNAFNDGLTKIGFQKMSINDIQKMRWESLEGEIAAWIKAFKHSITISFSYERELAASVFSGHQAIASSLFSNLARGVIIQLLSFVEAVAMTKYSAEKLFKVLDMYEALRDMMTAEMDNLFPAELEGSPSLRTDLQLEISSIRSRLGEAAVAIFCDLESSIKADDSRIPVPSGAIHPLTRYVMNYLKYASEYKNTLEQVFQDHQKSGNESSGNDKNRLNCTSPFAMQFIEAMDLLDSNLESKSKLYKDPALSYIFLMNNGRYIMKKIKGSSEIPELLGDSLIRRRSSDLRQYHKNYQREAWSKVLACFKDEGLQVKGNVSKQMVKERFKSFNAMFEEIHRRQSAWMVSDEQMQSELRVSVSAVIVPAYRSFLGRFRQYLSSDKHVKYGPDDLENYIDELFSGNPSVGMKKRT